MKHPYLSIVGKVEDSPVDSELESQKAIGQLQNEEWLKNPITISKWYELCSMYEQAVHSAQNEAALGNDASSARNSLKAKTIKEVMTLWKVITTQQQ